VPAGPSPCVIAGAAERGRLSAGARFLSLLDPRFVASVSPMKPSPRFAPSIALVAFAALSSVACGADSGSPAPSSGAAGYTAAAGGVGGGGPGAGGAFVGAGGNIGPQGGSAGVGAGGRPSGGAGGVIAQGGAGGVAQGGAGGVAQGGAAGMGTPGVNTEPGFKNLAPPKGTPLNPAGTALNPPAPAGWVWNEIPGAVCRDGSPAGFFVRYNAASDKLMWYLEGGGACISPGFCTYNPASVNQVLSGTGETVATSIGGAVAGRQQPSTTGIFDATNAANPFKDWNQIYTPYCTGDVFFGTRPNATVPGLFTPVLGSTTLAPQQFVGYLNMQKFTASIVATFASKVKRVILTGASAGGFGAALNFSMVQDAFGSVKVDAIDDSGPPFSDQYSPVCMQKAWRDLWGFEASLPPDCTECRQADGGGLIRLSEFLLKKHKNATIAMISSMQDEVIRLFYSAGLKNCAGFATADPTAITLGQLDPTIYLPAATYTSGVTELRTKFQSTGRFATYFLAGANAPFHQHIWRARFLDPAAGTESIAQFATKFLAGTMEQIGP